MSPAGLLAVTLSAMPAGEAPLRVGSKRFTESYILAEIAVQAARAAGAAAIHVEGLGGTALVFRALEEGSIDTYPEYTGTIAETLRHDTGARLEAGGGDELVRLQRALAALNLAMTPSLGFDDSYALATSAGTAAARGLSTISDLARGGLRFGLSPEFLGRGDGFPALRERYGISDAHVEALEHGLAYEALARGAIDVIDVYSTDAKIERYGLKVLADDRRFFPSYEAVFLYRRDALVRAPRAMAAVEALAGTIDRATMTSLNARAEIDGWTFASVAEAFLRSRAGAPRTAGSGRPGLLGGMLGVVRAEGPRHVTLVAAALALAAAVGVPVGVLASGRGSAGRFVLAATSIVQTVPALALLCFFVPLLGTGALPALAALFLYALLPIVRSTVAGLDGIPSPLRESAIALGLTRRARLLRVELPLASRAILAGIRTSAVIAVGGATLAAFVGAGGFGAPISVGLNLDDPTLILEGAIPAALLALAVEAGFTLVARVLVPQGLRLRLEASEEDR